MRQRGLPVLLLLLFAGSDAGYAALRIWASAPRSSAVAVCSRAGGGGSSAKRRSSSCERVAGCQSRRAPQLVSLGRARRSRVVIACDGEIDADLASAWMDGEAASSLAADDQGPQELSAIEAAALLREGAITLLDLRTHAQHCAARPEGATSLPAGEPGSLGLLFCFKESFVAEVAETFSSETPLVLLCDVGVVSRIAATRLLANGHASVRLVAGGFEAWSLDAEEKPTDLGLPIVFGRPEDATWPSEEDVSRSAEDLWDEDDEYEQLDVDALYADADTAASAWNHPSADGTPAPLSPRPYGTPSVVPAGSLDDDLGLGLGADESLDIDDLEALLADAGDADFEPDPAAEAVAAPAAEPAAAPATGAA